MPRKKRDGFDALADWLRTDPSRALKSAAALQAIYLLPLVEDSEGVGTLMPEDVLPLVYAIRRDRYLFLGAAALRGAAAEALAPRRKAGRPRKSEGPIDFPGVLRIAADRRRIDEVAKALVAEDLPKGDAAKAMAKAAGRFSAKRSRPVAFEAMKRFRAQLEEVEAAPRKRTRDDRPTFLAARVVLEARGEPASAEDGRRFLRRLQRGSVVREMKLASRGVSHVREEAGAALLARLDAARPKRAR